MGRRKVITKQEQKKLEKAGAGCLTATIKYFFLAVFWIIAWPVMLARKLYSAGKLNKGFGIACGIGGMLVWFGILALMGGKTSDVTKDDNQPIRSISIRETATPKPTATPIPVSKPNLTANKTEFYLGETVAYKVSIEPYNASDKQVSWVSSDLSVATVSSTGKVTAVGEGAATISATAGGKTETVNIVVDGSKWAFDVKIDTKRTDDANIGDEWSFLYSINEEYIRGGTVPLSVGERLTLAAEITESDDNPDIGKASVAHRVTEQDLNDGFSETFTVRVTENGGRNSGQSAIFEVTYIFSKG